MIVFFSEGKIKKKILGEIQIEENEIRANLHSSKKGVLNHKYMLVTLLMPNVYSKYRICSFMTSRYTVIPRFDVQFIHFSVPSVYFK